MKERRKVLELLYAACLGLMLAQVRRTQTDSKSVRPELA